MRLLVNRGKKKSEHSINNAKRKSIYLGERIIFDLVEWRVCVCCFIFPSLCIFSTKYIKGPLLEFCAHLSVQLSPLWYPIQYISATSAAFPTSASSTYQDFCALLGFYILVAPSRKRPQVERKGKCTVHLMGLSSLENQSFSLPMLNACRVFYPDLELVVEEGEV